MKNLIRIKVVIFNVIFLLAAGNFLYFEKVHADGIDNNTYLTGINGGQVYSGNNHEYMIINQPMTWDEAKGYSERNGGYLATIATEKEKLFVENLAAAQGTLSSYWLGATDEVKEEEWKWITGEPFSFVNWADGEPNNALGQHSENYLAFSKDSGVWKDEQGSNPASGFIIEWDSQKDIQNADVNLDGVVDVLDLGLVGRSYNKKDPVYDVNKDSIVDIYDLVKVSKKLSMSYKENNGVSIGNTFGNILNSGAAAKDSESIYYRNGNDGGKLYKSDTQGILSTKLSDDAVFSLNVIGNWIYYRNDSDGGKLYKIRTDGTDRTKISEDKNIWFAVSGQWIYYTNGSDSSRLYKIKTNGLERQKISEDSTSFLGLKGSELYYLNTLDNNRLYKVNVDGTNRIRLSEDSVTSYGVWGNLVYYANKDDNNYIYVMDTSGQNKQRFFSDSALNLNIAEGYIYYCNAEDGKLYKLDIEEKVKSKIGDEVLAQNAVSNLINLVDNWIYYGNGADNGKLYKITDEGTLKQAIDNYKVYQNSSLLDVFNSQEEALDYAKLFDHSKIIGANSKVIWHNYAMYRVYDGTVLSEEFSTGELFNAIEYAKALEGGRVVKITSDARDGDLIWNKEKYRVYYYQELKKVFESQSQAEAYGSTIDHALVMDMNGIKKWDNYPKYRVSQKNIYTGEFKTLLEAIQAASSKANSSVVKLENILTDSTVEVWNNNAKKYYVYEGEALAASFDSLNDSLLLAQNGSSRLVVDAAGIVLWNSSNVLKGFVTSASTPLNVRKGPSTSNSIMGTLNYLSPVEITKVLTGWYEIKYGTDVGYVSAQYIELGDAAQRQKIIKISIGITSKFEGEGYTAIAGNFDGQGMSMGLLQWNIGSGTLQPLLKRMDNEYNPIMKTIFDTNYESIHSMLQMALTEQLAWAVTINDASNKIIEPWYTQFKTLCSAEEFQQIQRDATSNYTSRAAAILYNYNLKTTRAYALAFDIATQNGSITSTAAGLISQAQQQNPNMTEKELLTVIANAVADAANPTYSEDVRSRKLCIVNGSGIVHRTQFYLDRDYGLSDDLAR